MTVRGAPVFLLCGDTAHGSASSRLCQYVGDRGRPARARVHRRHSMSSRRNNETAGITGALLATDDRFAQVLEGEQKTVEET